MSYSPSPRPSFDGPAHIRFDRVTRHLWGDLDSGQVADWIYISSQEIHQLIFGLPVGGVFQHSDQFRTIFAADEVLYVLQGLMVIANPATGEVHRVPQGESVFFRRDTWHHCFSMGDEPLRVLEYLAPPPAQGTSGAYAQTRELITENLYVQDQWIEGWPISREKALASNTIQVLREPDILWRLEGQENQVLTGILASTEYLTVGRIDLMPGQHSDVQTHRGEEGLYLLEGSLNVLVPENDGQRWFELHPGDGFFIPAGVPHHYHNITSRPARLLFGVAPAYRAAA